MEVNKMVAGICGALLVFLGLNFFAEQVFHPHQQDELAYSVEIEDAGDDEEEEVAVDFAAIFAAADPVAGEKVFKKCTACHAVEDGDNKVGPHLWGVVQRQIGSVEGFGYSGALPEDQAWTGENLYAFLAAPKKWAKGTSMGFAGLRKSEDRADVIALSLIHI